jgi:hypothetical protein
MPVHLDEDAPAVNHRGTGVSPVCGRGTEQARIERAEVDSPQLVSLDAVGHHALRTEQSDHGPAIRSGCGVRLARLGVACCARGPRIGFTCPDNLTRRLVEAVDAPRELALEVWHPSTSAQVAQNELGLAISHSRQGKDLAAGNHEAAMPRARELTTPTDVRTARRVPLRRQRLTVGDTSGKFAAKGWPPVIAAGRRRAEDRRKQDEGGHHAAGSKGREHAGFRSHSLSPAWSDTLSHPVCGTLPPRGCRRSRSRKPFPGHAP